MTNVVVLVGRLIRDPELRTTSSGKSVTSFSIAVNKRVKPTDGSPDADFFSVVAWGHTAEFVNDYLGKGRLVAVEGRLQSRKYTTSEGSTRDVVEVVASNVQSLDRPREDNGNNERPASKAPRRSSSGPPPTDEYDPFADE